jgi:thioester reductase-like protein
MTDQQASRPDAPVSSRMPAVDRRREAELLEGDGLSQTALASLLARSRPPTAASPSAAGSALPGPATPGPATPGPGAVAGRDGSDADGGGGERRAWDSGQLSAAIVDQAAQLLGGRPIDADTDFFEAGATSVDAVRLAAAMTRELGVQVTLDDIFADARPGRLAQRWIAQAATALPALPAPQVLAPSAPKAPSAPAPLAPSAPATPPALAAPSAPRVPAAADDDLAAIAADLARADQLPWTDLPELVPPSRILLTGATGFLGSHLLLDLLRHSDAHVVCLVRGSGDQAAEQRLAEALASFQLPWSAEVRRRVTVLAGDIRQPRLGLTVEQWTALSGDVDAVVSVAAAVDFLRGYPSLRQTNVLAVHTLAELAATGRIKPLHHISSIAVFNEVGIASMGEDDPVAHADRLAAGYDKTKWAAEALLRRARERGLVVTLLRPGGIGGHTQTGAYNSRDLSSGLLSAVSRFRTVPPFRFLNVAPVDWVSRMAAAIICEPDGWGQTYNLVGKPSTLADMVQEMQLGGMNLRVSEWGEWRREVLGRLTADPVPELDFLTRVLQSPTALKLCEATLFGPAATGDRAEAFAARHGLPAPARYDTTAQLKAFERMAADGLAQLPGPGDAPYLWFPETMTGSLRPADGADDAPCTLSLTLSIASMYQLLRERRIDVRGEIRCLLLPAGALTVQAGEVLVRPGEGVPLRHGTEHPLLSYRLSMTDAGGTLWWLEGRKTARARRDLWYQARALDIQVGRVGEPASLAGRVVVPGDSYVREQIDGIQVDPRLSPQEQRTAKLAWLAWFGSQVGRGLLEPMLRAGADLLDLRREATPTTDVRKRQQ